MSNFYALHSRGITRLSKEQAIAAYGAQTNIPEGYWLEGLDKLGKFQLLNPTFAYAEGDVIPQYLGITETKLPVYHLNVLDRLREYPAGLTLVIGPSYITQIMQDVSSNDNVL